MSDKPQANLVDYNPFQGNVIEKVVPLTEAQQELWASCIIGGEEANLAYNESISLQLTGRIDIDAMKEAIRDIIARHESLRASFSPDGQSMIIYESIDDDFLFVHDISHEPQDEQNNIIATYTDADASKTFSLASGPLVRFTLFKKSKTSLLLHISTHHIVCDGWSFGIMLEDLSAVYNSIIGSTVLPALPEQYSNYAVEDHQFLKTEEYANTLGYWVRQFKNNVPSFELPPDFERSSVRTYTSSRNDYEIDKLLADEIKKIASEHNCSFVTMLMSVFEVLMFKLTGKTDVVLGIPTSGQAASGMFNLIGHCVNLLPVRSRIKPESTFKDYLLQRKRETLNDYDHQRFTFGSLLKHIGLHRDSSRIPLVPVSFNIDIGMDMNVSFSGLQHHIIYNKRKAETFELFLNITEAGKKYIFQWTYNTNLYRKETIKKWMDIYRYLLEQISVNPATVINDFKTFPPSAFEYSFVKKNNIYKALPETNVLALFESVAAQQAGKIAIEFKGEEITYDRLNVLSNKLAHNLIASGLQPGSIAAITLERSIWLPITMLAVLKCGALYLPLDPEFPESRIRFMLDDCAAFCNITNRKYAERFYSNARTVILEDVINDLEPLPATNPDTQISHQSLAYIIYTSGSTGLPKGVKINHHNLLNFLLAMKEIFHTTEKTRLLAITTISFDIAGLEIFLPLISGGTIILADEHTTKSGESILKRIKERKVNMIQATPSTYKLMMEVKDNEMLAVTALCGGEALTKNLADLLLKRVQKLYNMYGPTETTIWSTVAEIKKEAQQITIGKPIQNTQVYILNKKGEMLPDGDVGEICIGGDGVSPGYYNREELTAEKFMPDNFHLFKGSAIYRTGDLGRYLPNGDIICLGRNDQQAKVRGYRIELGDIEYHLSKLDSVKDAVCVVKTDNKGENYLAAFIIHNNPDDSVSKKQILQWRSQLKQVLPHYMIPEEFVKLTEFPLTPNKKIDRKRLQSMKTGVVQANTLIKNETDTLIKQIKKIWAEELNIPNISKDDDFFELGGHSMKAIQVMARIEKETGCKLPIAVLFENTTIQKLAKLIKNPVYNTSKVLVPIKKEGSRPPIYLIHAGGLNILIYKSLGQFFEEEQPLYGLQGLGLDGDLTDLKNMESIAARYLKEILEYNPDGPYIIFGYSFGGIIAYEIARQLKDMGKEIHILGVLDTYAKPGYEHHRVKHYYHKTIRQFRKALFFSKRFFNNPVETYLYQKKAITRIVNKNAGDVEDQIYDYDDSVIAAYESAYNNYIMKPLDVKLHLFRVQERFYYLDDPVHLGWKEYALKGIKIYSIPGDHKTFLTPPNDKVLAEIIQSAVSDLN